jgi:hypothetical protein
MARTVHLPVVGLGNTLRKDAWWALPLTTVIVLVSFIAYATFRGFENAHYHFTAGGADYLSPMYSPLLFEGAWAGFFTPAMLILPGPASFRLTCYYYRKAYYRSFGMDPPACAVGEPASRTNYNGERVLWVFNNLHRFTLYVALAYIVILWHDAWRALWFGGHLGVGVGTIVMFVNVTLLSLYTFSCHALRHLVGGSVNSYSTSSAGALRFKLWSAVSKLNTKHGAFAWMSLFGVALTDLYIRSVASGAIADLRLF